MLQIKKNILTMMLFTLVACSSGPKIQEFPDTANPAAEVTLFSQDLKAAQTQQVDILAPKAYAQATEDLKKAESFQEKGKDAKDVLHQVAKGRAQLELANNSATVSRVNMEEVVNARQAALNAQAPKYAAESFGIADAHLTDLTKKIEKNNLKGIAQERNKLQEEYLNAELISIKELNLNGARAAIDQAKEEGAKDFAKRSLAIAEKKFMDAENFITANRYQTSEVQSRAQEATVAAEHLLKITRASKAGKNVNSEETALLMEKEQGKTQDQKNQLEIERESAQGLAVETSNLKFEQNFNRSFEAARSEFTNNEAEVYRQGNRLVIRLRSLEFPVNQSVLRENNFPLLSKVATVIKGFPNPTVVVEGHTDSDGSSALNKKLSTERSSAVSSYLVANEAIDQNKISAVGKGFDRPLATNKTAAGKAQNRRVDIIISPQVLE